MAGFCFQSHVAAADTLQADLRRLLAVQTPHYTGGLSRAKRALSARIVTALRPKFPEIKCIALDPDSGSLLGYSDEYRRNRTQQSLAEMDADLAVLVRAARDKIRVRRSETSPRTRLA